MFLWKKETQIMLFTTIVGCISAMVQAGARRRSDRVPHAPRRTPRRRRTAGQLAGHHAEERSGN